MASLIDSTIMYWQYSSELTALFCTDITIMYWQHSCLLTAPFCTNSTLPYWHQYHVLTAVSPRYAYSIRPNPWEWLTTRRKAEAMAERVGTGLDCSTALLCCSTAQLLYYYSALLIFCFPCSTALPLYCCTTLLLYYCTTFLLICCSTICSNTRHLDTRSQLPWIGVP